MLRYVEIDGYTLVTVGPDDIGSTTQLMEYRTSFNREYLNQLVKPPKGGRLTGAHLLSAPGLCWAQYNELGHLGLGAGCSRK